MRAGILSSHKIMLDSLEILNKNILKNEWRNKLLLMGVYVY